MRITFDDTPLFAAAHAAEQWCADRGLSVGSMQRHAPRGIDHGDCLIGKWRTLNDADKSTLLGRMTGDQQHGPVTIEIDGDEEHWEAVRRAVEAIE